ncbi:putative acyl-CoA dehydrogenase [Marinospirillum celere]|uniref:Putative acyl-CoA dehydrogenase n=1 Tax=Marinospirillum celere TaxID=1122252 RepID=A0A1I1I489_9GAMM|nr:isovaleryl-CoA dehydrogenase [Marinospirillum celere]SFC28503.1 putative acyl-CoA dehydrogenase [Marinospirillum celere]
MSGSTNSPSDFLATTHQVENQPPLLVNYNPYLQDQALQEGVRREGASWAEEDLTHFGAFTGQEAIIQLGFEANAHKPTFESHDRRGERVDLVRFHPAYHRLMQIAVQEGLHAAPWSDPKPGAQVARAAKYYLHTQVEAAHGCPITMSFAALPTLLKQENVTAPWIKKLFSRDYDPSNQPFEQKTGITLGMAMTEKQGGSDVRSNTTRAYPLGQEGPGQAYELVGHKYFVSAPMSDGFLVLAQAPGGLSCFLLPRWKPDGTKNPLQIQQLKNKMGNVANASSETELLGALAWMLGEEGKGVRTIIEMVAMTRYDCMLGSSAGMRQATAQALHHTAYRQAFGKPLNQQPLMQNLLADLALESEAALALTLRLSRALDNQQDEHEQALLRLATPIGKYWICKRTPNHAYEAMEIIGGSGVMENHIMPRLFRESPINSIWEGSGNVQCLDVLRAWHKSPESLEVYLDEVSLAQGSNTYLDHFLQELRKDLKDTSNLEYRARNLVDRLALALQASLLVRNSPHEVSDAFCASRLQAGGGLNYGNLPPGVACQTILTRATPQI